MSGKTDHDLLARLNALKKSTIDLDRVQATPSMPTADDGDDIARRFLGLRSKQDHQLEQGHNADSTEPAHDPDEVESIDEMLKELKSTGKSSLAPGDGKRVQILLAQAQNALDDDQEDEHATEASIQGAPPKELDNDEHDPAEHDQDREGETSSVDEDAEADELLAQILAEVQLSADQHEDEHGTGQDAGDDDDDDEDPPGHVEENLFPTTPSKEPELPSDSQDGSVQLPSVPTSAPVRPKSKTTTNKYSDAEIETWCEICQADAEVRCLGCDGELYCFRCWKEGHTGPDVGYEEKRHRCVQYSKPGPQAAAA